MAGRSGGSHVMMNETKEKCSPTIKGKKLASNSDSDASGESLSLSQESNNTEIHLNKYQGAEKAGVNPKKLNRRNSEWEIIEGLRDGQRYDIRPEPFSGYLNKKRKWPLKGWHKRYFILDEGILKYGKSPSSVHLGKIHGSVDIGLSVISTKSKRKRIDIDAEEFIYHLKAKQYDFFAEWTGQLKKHRLYRQHMLTFGTSKHLLSHQRESVAKLPLTRKLASDVVDNASTRVVSSNNTATTSRPSTSSPATQIRFQTFLNDSGPLQVAATELNHTRQALAQLGKILEKLESTHHDENTVDNNFSPSVMKKDRRKFGLRKKKSGGIGCAGAGKSGSSVDLVGTGSENQLTTITPMPSPSKSDLDQNMASDFYILAKDVYTSLKSVAATVQTESDRVKSSSASSPDGERTRRALNVALRQNSELRERLGSISRTSNIGDLPEPARLMLRSSLSRTSVASEFFDAEENPGSDEEEEEEDEDAEATSDASSGGSSAEDGGSVSSEPSELADDSEYNVTVHEDDYDLATKLEDRPKETMTGRRSKLPAPRPATEGLSLWNLLTRNIGKDLSQVSMPVALNEPLSMLQRMCEELEYSDLLDKAALLTDPLERMIYVTAFAVSSYSSSYLRAGSKPFNPLLGETYEAIREDRGFKFMAEQVSHHPPISACHASSKNFTFWQDLRIKTKFWGKSMEFQPSGFVHLKLERSSNGTESESHSQKCDYYKWNKVTACVHSLFSETRWLEQYGEMTIHNEALKCDVNFVRTNYWSPKRYELQGSITDTKTKQVLTKVFGKWNEALYVGLTPSTAKCVWRPGTLPPDHHLYYNFTQFAIELNELQPDMSNYLPPTDTRFRPDQRFLEQGRQDEAERIKMVLEQNQRDRRKRQEALGRPYEPRWFRKGKDEDGDEVWDFTGDYWTVRTNTGFVNLQIEPLW